MKSVKTLPIFIFLFFSGIAKAQFFPDSLLVTGIHYLATVSPGYPFYVKYYRDSVHFDSANGTEEFYTVHKRVSTKSAFVSTALYKIKVRDKKVYFTGNVYYGQSISLTDKLIYDYNFSVGDTFRVRINSDTLLDIKFRVDSIKMITYLDGINRMTHYYTVKQGSRTLDAPFFSGEGIGSSSGLLYLNTDDKFPLFYWNKLVSVCTPQQMVYGNADCRIGNYLVKPSCEEDSLKMELQRAEWAGIIETKAIASVNVYPNPSLGSLYIDAKGNGSFSLMDPAGKVCLKDIAFTEGKSSIDISALKAGIYMMTIQTGNEVYSRRICILIGR